MKKKYLAWLSLCLSLSCSAAHAQKVITFDSKPVKTHGKSRREDPSGNNSVTLSVGSYLSGFTALYYERKLTSMLSVSLGGGFTYRSYLNDLGMLVWNDGQNSNFSSAQYIEDDYASYKFRKSTPGLYAAISPRFYVNDDPLDGLYIGPMLELKQFRYEARLADVSVPVDKYGYSYQDAEVPRTTAVMPEQMNCIDLTFVSGGHYQLRNHMALGWSVAVGVRRVNAERLDIGAVNDAAGNLSYVNNVYSYSATRPLFQFNFVMGGWF